MKQQVTSSPCIQNVHHICFNSFKLSTGRYPLFYFANRAKKRDIHRSRCILSLPSCWGSLRTRSILSKVIQKMDVFPGYHRMHYCVNFLTYKLCFMKRKQIHSCVCWTPSALKVGEVINDVWMLLQSKTLPFNKTIKGSWSGSWICKFFFKGLFLTVVTQGM